jgi:hypothetical protein
VSTHITHDGIIRPLCDLQLDKLAIKLYSTNFFTYEAINFLYQKYFQQLDLLLHYGLSSAVSFYILPYWVSPLKYPSAVLDGRPYIMMDCLLEAKLWFGIWNIQWLTRHQRFVIQSNLMTHIGLNIFEASRYVMNSYLDRYMLRQPLLKPTFLQDITFYFKRFIYAVERQERCIWIFDSMTSSGKFIDVSEEGTASIFKFENIVTW